MGAGRLSPHTADVRESRTAAATETGRWELVDCPHIQRLYGRAGQLQLQKQVGGSWSDCPHIQRLYGRAGQLQLQNATGEQDSCSCRTGRWELVDCPHIQRLYGRAGPAAAAETGRWELFNCPHIQRLYGRAGQLQLQKQVGGSWSTVPTYSGSTGEQDSCSYRNR